MKKYKFFALAFAAMTLAACSSDDVVDDGAKGGAVAPGETGYVSLAINLPSQPSTRIDEVYDAGTGAENEVKSAYLLLFSGASESAATFQSAYDLTDDIEGWTETTGSVSKYAKVVKQITRPLGDNIYAMVVLNGGNGDTKAIKEGTSATEGWKFGGNALAANSTAFSSIYSTALTLQLSDVTGSTDGFLMTNAPMYTKPGGSVVPTDGSVQTLAPVAADKIYDSEADAQVGAATANVYVERAVAKVSVAGSNKDGGQDMIAYDIDGFSLDVTNNKTYLVRNVDGADWWGHKSTDASVTGENQYRFVGNDVVGTDAVGTNLYRTYFGKDPNYSTAPATGDLSIGVAQTYNALPKYCFENTFDVANMKQDATTHVVIGAKLSGLTDQAAEGDFYTMYGNKDKLYDGLDDVTSQVLTEYLDNATIDALLSPENINEGQTVTAADFDVTYNGKETTGGYVQVKTVTVKEASKTKFKNSTVPVGLESNATVLAAVNNTMNIAYYKGGVSYYPVMIKHFGDDETPWGAATGQTESYPGPDAAQKWLGRYGVLRNNSYNITVNKVTEIGYPEAPGSYPGSYDDPVESWISVTINILPWVVRNQGVDL